MFDTSGRWGTATVPLPDLPLRVAAPRRGRCRPPAVPAEGSRRPGGRVAAESAPAYRTAPRKDAPAGSGSASPPGGPVAEAGRGVAGTAGAQGRAAVADLAQHAGTSALAAAVSRVADAVAALGGVEVAGEHVDDLKAAVLALHHLGCRLDAGVLAVLAAYDRREGYRDDGAVTCASQTMRQRRCLSRGGAGKVQPTRRDHAPATRLGKRSVRWSVESALRTPRRW